mmetsp:Transcript_42456/g.66470  ORF Transcript_42456/g.66470 Transcript_42456/m.66470 type:complete len:248 (-) Transcript_42456:81-824(-)
MTQMQKSGEQQHKEQQVPDVHQHDTVGAVCIDQYGNLASSVSSGGLSLKIPGRVGEAAIFGCGCYADNGAHGAQGINSGQPNRKRGVAVSTTGTGEEIMMRQLSSGIAASCAPPNRDLFSAIKQNFRPRHGEWESWTDPRFSYQRTPKVERWLGAINLIATWDSDEEDDDGVVTKSADLNLVWAHTSHAMPVCYQSSADRRPKWRMSTVGRPQQTGQKQKARRIDSHTETPGSSVILSGAFMQYRSS